MVFLISVTEGAEHCTKKGSALCETNQTPLEINSKA
jgi:hypothetical protein